MKNRRIYIAGIILAMFVASVGTSACGNKGNAGSGQKQTSEHKQQMRVRKIRRQVLQGIQIKQRIIRAVQILLQAL